MNEEKELMALKNRRARLWDYFSNPSSLIRDDISKQRFEELCMVNNRIAHLEGQAVPDSAREEEIRRILFAGEDDPNKPVYTEFGAINEEMGIPLKDDAAIAAQKRIELRRRCSEIYRFLAQSREKQDPEKAKDLYAELFKINETLHAAPPTANETRQLFGSPPISGDTAVEHPSHYTSGGIECIDAMKAMLAGYEQEQITTKYYWHFLAGQVLKYLWRWPLKERPLQDLKKARWYLDRLITDVENQDHAVTELHSDMGKEISE